MDLLTLLWVTGEKGEETDELILPVHFVDLNTKKSSLLFLCHLLLTGLLVCSP